MLQFKDDPKELMLALDRFLSIYYGDRQVESKRKFAEIAAWQIPDSLKYFYSFAKKYPGIIDFQDGLFLNQGQDTNGGKFYIYRSLYRRYFTQCYTTINGTDPPVWIEQLIEYKKLTSKLVGDSLSQFLVTISLKQVLFSTEYIYNFIKIDRGVNLNDLLSAIKEQDCNVSLLWRSNHFWNVFFNRMPRTIYFYSVEDAILICSNGFCATNYKNADRLLSSILLV